MPVNGGAGNAISFSELRAFYTDGNQNTGSISLSDYNRGGDNVPSSVAGADTLTSSSGNFTKNDFNISVTGDSISSTINGGFSQAGTSFTIDTGTGGGSTTTLTVFVQSGESGAYSLRQGGINGTEIGQVSEGQTTNFTVNDNVTYGITQAYGDPQAGSYSYTRLTGVSDITFTNNNSTGDTYTLASSSSRLNPNDASQLVYSAGTSRKVKDNSSNTNWQIAYDNVTGAGAGTAGDISVSAPFYTGSAANVMQDSLTIQRAQTQLGTGNNGVSMSLSYTVLPSDALFVIGGGGFDNIGQGEQQLSSGWQASGAITLGPQGQGLAFTGPAYNNKLGFSGNLAASGTSGGISTGTLTLTTTAGSAGGNLSIATARRFGAINFQNNNSSKSYSLGSSTTGGAAELAASATRGVNTGTISSNPSWAVYFDTSTGPCNTNIPTTIGSGNPVNLDIFNAPGTPVGS